MFVKAESIHSGPPKTACGVDVDDATASFVEGRIERSTRLCGYITQASEEPKSSMFAIVFIVFAESKSNAVYNVGTVV